MITPLPAIDVPSPARTVIQLLEDAGFEAWCVGGFVRDAVMGRPAHDVDLASNASWQQLKALCDSARIPVREIGVKHGTLTVLLEGEALEVTTYRIDGAYSDGRHPDQVSAARNIEEDLKRRDFTINAMAYHPERGLLDPFGGQCDIEAGVIRTVGNPRERFKEDALRILRACRFVSQLGFQMNEATFQAALSQKSLLGGVAMERMRDEMERFLLGAHVHDALLGTVDILAFPFPELVAMKGCQQHTPYHIYDVLEHTAWAVQNIAADPILRWTMLFHDMGKPGGQVRRARRHQPFLRPCEDKRDAGGGRHGTARVLEPSAGADPGAGKAPRRRDRTAATAGAPRPFATGGQPGAVPQAVRREKGGCQRPGSPVRPPHAAGRPAGAGDGGGAGGRRGVFPEVAGGKRPRRHGRRHTPGAGGGGSPECGAGGGNRRSPPQPTGRAPGIFAELGDWPLSGSAAPRYSQRWEFSKVKRPILVPPKMWMCRWSTVAAESGPVLITVR